MQLAPEPDAVGQSPVRHAGETLEPEELWDLHGKSLYAMAHMLLCEESSAERALTSALQDLYAPHRPAPFRGTAFKEAATLLYMHAARTPTLDLHDSLRDVPSSDTFANLSLLESGALALCLHGGHTYRGAAHILQVQPESIARLLISALNNKRRAVMTADDVTSRFHDETDTK